MTDFPKGVETEREVSIQWTNSYVDLTIRNLQQAYEREPFQRWADNKEVDHPRRITDNPYWEIIRMASAEGAFARFGERQVGWGLTTTDVPGIDRRVLCHWFAHSIPSPRDLSWLRDHVADREVVEIGAGSGYWAWQLNQLGITTHAYDDGSWEWAFKWSDVQMGGPGKAADHPNAVLLLVWPPYNTPMAVEALAAYQGDTLIYAGEPEEGCTGDDDFFIRLGTEWEHVEDAPGHVTYEGIHCQLAIYRRRPL